MKQNKTIEVTVCDVCGAENVPKDFFYVERCNFCNGEVCERHSVVLEMEASFVICRTHIDPEILKKLGGE